MGFLPHPVGEIAHVVETSDGVSLLPHFQAICD